MAIYMYGAENVEFKFSRLRRHLKYLEIIFIWNRISLDLNYSSLAGTSLTVITEMFQL